MKHWPTKTLGDFVAKKSGSVDPSKFPDEIFELYSIPAFDGGNPEVRHGREIGSSKQIVEPNDVLLSRIVPHIRRAWVVGENRGKRLIASGEWIVFRSPHIHPRYLRHFLVGDPFHAQFMQTVSGVGGSLLRAKASEVAKICILVPPLVEQRHIVKLLDEADQLRKLRTQIDRRMADVVPALFHEMFGDAEQNSKQWPILKVGDICDLVRGSSPRPRSDPRYYGGPIPRLMIEDITRDGWEVTPQIDTLTELGATMSRPVKAGTIVMAVSGNIGLCAQLAVDACIHDGFVAFKNLHTEVLLPLFFGMAIGKMRQSHLRNQAGAIFQNITTTDVKAMDIPVPPLALQHEFAQRVAKIRELQAEQSISRHGLDDLFNSMLHRAFNAEL
jgi:type I restriction enzyme S subunit